MSMNSALDSEDSLQPLPSLRCNDFEPEDIFHPARQGAKDEEHILSPQKRRRTHLYPGIRRKQNPRIQKRQPNSDDVQTVIDYTVDEGTSGADYSEDMGIDNGVGDDFVKYADAVLSEGVGFIHLHRGLFAVEGWSKENGQGNSHWYHFEVSGLSDQHRTSCLCPAGAWNCFHKRYYAAYGSEFGATENNQGPNPMIILFLKENVGFEGGRAIHLFSVSKSSDMIGISQRAIVKHIGSDSGDGSWRCSSENKDPVLLCAHIVAAQKFMKGNSNIDGLQQITNGVDISSSKSFSWRSLRAVSHLPILPPRWCMLLSDKEFYPRPRPLRDPPPLLLLSEQASCPCLDGERTFFDPQQPTITRACLVYTLTQAFSIQIQLQLCSRCPPEHRRYIGPELRDLGLFNFNNSAIFTHELLNEYISAFSSSETPFEPWVRTIARRYEEMEPSIPFVGSGLFRSAWFAYARLVCFEGDKSCPSCGIYPDSIIWDGVSVAFGRKHVNSELQPPTVIKENAPERPSKPFPRQEWLQDAKMRKKLRDWLTEGGLTRRIQKGAETNTDNLLDLDTGFEHKRILQLEIYPWLDSLCPSLKALFSRSLGNGALQGSKGWSPRREYLILFQILVAEESTMQTMTRPALNNLKTFLNSPTQNNLQGLLEIPALYTILELEHARGGQYATDTLGVAKWMYIRGQEVLDGLLAINSMPIKELTTRNIMPTAQSRETLEIRDWEKTGCCYGLPEIRYRPQYPKLPHDGKADISKERTASCRKYYETYSQKRLTGGIMACWCSHSICYGFHCIPIGEGRNDVFSAIITRWPKAPSRVVYDFACALGPYCWSREPGFFADTQFVIDGFHAPGHTKCSPAAFLKTYSAVNPDLTHINSSAAECGNSGIARIRKSVSYMGQTRAIIYCRVFISVWNRLQILGLYKRAGQLL